MRCSMTALFFLMVCFTALSAQGTTVSNIRFFTSPEVERVIQNYTNTNRSTTTVRGWRLQILSTTDRERMEQTRNSFRVQFPYLPVSYVHNRPYYMLRVGAFTDQKEAVRIQYLIRPYFPSTYLVQDNEIKVSELLDTF
jgi:hypothetical protein